MVRAHLNMYEENKTCEIQQQLKNIPWRIGSKPIINFLRHQQDCREHHYRYHLAVVPYYYILNYRRDEYSGNCTIQCDQSSRPKRVALSGAKGLLTVI